MFEKFFKENNITANFSLHETIKKLKIKIKHLIRSELVPSRCEYTYENVNEILTFVIAIADLQTLQAKAITTKKKKQKIRKKNVDCTVCVNFEFRLFLLVNRNYCLPAGIGTFGFLRKDF